MTDQPHVETFAAGDAPLYWIPGDVLLCRNLAPWYSRSGWVSGGIRHVQRHKFTGDDRKFCWPNHVASVVSTSGDLVEALGHGVAKTHADKYRPVEFRVVHTNLDTESAAHAVAYWESTVGEHYGFPTCASIAVAIYLDWPLEFGVRSSPICSANACMGLVAGGVLFPRTVEPGQALPCELAKFYGVAA